MLHYSVLFKYKYILFLPNESIKWLTFRISCSEQHNYTTAQRQQNAVCKSLCVVFVQLSTIAIESDVDVGQTIKRMRAHRCCCKCECNECNDNAYKVSRNRANETHSTTSVLIITRERARANQVQHDLFQINYLWIFVGRFIDSRLAV